MRRRATVAVGVTIALVFVFASACADLFGFKTLTEGEASPADVVVPEGGGLDVDTCDHATWPQPPPSNEGLDAGNFTFAIRHLYLSTNVDGGAHTLGYDLDGRCTTNAGTASCMPATGATLVTDDTGGVDDESDHLLRTLTMLGLGQTLQDSAINAAIANGNFTILLRLFGYTGTGNQTSSSGLTFAFQSSPGLVTGLPTFDGGDPWVPASQDVAGGFSTPNLFITNTWVTSGTLVVSYSGAVSLRFILPLGDGGTVLSGPMVIRLSQPVLTATVVPRSDGQYNLSNGVVAGRWAISDMLSTIAQLQVNGGEPLCTYDDASTFPVVQGIICPNRDITSTGKDDGTQTCDAISVAIAFDATASGIANFNQTFPTPSASCPDAGVCP